MNQRNNLKRQALFYIPIIIIVLCFVGSFSMSWLEVREVLRKQNRHMASTVTEKVFNDINSKLEQSVTVGRYIAADSFILDTLENEANFTREEMESRLSAHLSKITEQFGLTTISVISDATRDYYTNLGFNKTIDPVNDSHDVWYNLFLAKNKPYDFDIDVDEVTGNTWTAFLNTRLENNGKFLGTSGVALTMSNMQQILIDYQNRYDVEITLVDKNGLVQVDVDDINIEHAILDNINYTATPEGFEYIESDNGYTVTRFMENLGWILVIYKDYGNSKQIFVQMLKDNLIMMGIVLLIVATLMHFLLKKSQAVAVEDYTKQLSAAAQIYESLHVIDLNNDSFKDIGTYNEDLKKAIGQDFNNANVSMQRVMTQRVDENFLKDILYFVDFTTLAERLTGKRSISQEFYSTNKMWCRATFIIVEKNVDGRPGKVLFGVENITEEKQREKRLRHLSETDGLTGIKNRAAGERAIKENIEEGREGLFCLLDADKFKHVNDNYGHAVGDKVICAIADSLKAAFRGNDVIMRLGGDEFAVYAVGVTDENAADKTIKRFFAEIDAINIPELVDYTVQVSLGAAFFKADTGMSFMDLYNRADTGTYASKKIQGNAYTISMLPL